MPVIRTRASKGEPEYQGGYLDKTEIDPSTGADMYEQTPIYKTTAAVY